MVVHLDIQTALDREMALLKDVALAPEQRHLLTWQAGQSLVAPQNLAQRPGFETICAELATDGWPVHLRRTGGDVTPQGPGIVNVSHIYATPPRHHPDPAIEYDHLCRAIETALGPGASRGWKSGAFCDGAYNVQYNGLKFAGTAMRFRKVKTEPDRFAVLAHALMLFEPPAPHAIAALNRFLSGLGLDRRIDPKAHTGLPAELSPDQFLVRLAQAFDAESGLRIS